MSEVRELTMVGGLSSRGVLSISDAPPWELRLVLGADEYTSTGADLFDSLVHLRRSLDADGILICCEGARSNVHPSGMSRQMGGGRRAYRLVSGRRPDQDDLVDIFDPTPAGDVVSVEEQRKAVEMLRSNE